MIEDTEASHVEVDLRAEWLTLAFPDAACRQWLAKQGVNERALLFAPTTILCGNITPHRDGTFELSPEGGEPALLIAAWDYPPFLGGQIVDLIAFIASDPDSWWTRTGNTLTLGEWTVDAMSDSTVHVVETPLDWVAARAAWERGAPTEPEPICVLPRDDCERSILLRSLPAIVTDTLEHGERIEAALRRPVTPLPKILVKENRLTP